MTIVNQNTRLICVETLEYPVFLGDMGKRQVGSFGPTVAAEVLEELGYAVVNESTVPVAEVITEGTPELIDGQWYRTWSAREHSPEEELTALQSAKTQLLTDILALRNNDFKVGFPHQLPGREDILHVQVSGVDRANILGFRVMAKEAVDRNDEEWMIEFRVYEDIEIPLTAQQMVDLADLAGLRVQQGYKTTWLFKDQVANATTVAELPQLPSTIFPQ